MQEIKKLLELTLKALKHLPEFECPLLFEEEDESGWYAKLGKGKYWRPHLDDGDSRRLQIALGIGLVAHDGGDRALARGIGVDRTEYIADHNGDIAAAARMAVLFIAAELGRFRP